MQQPPQQSPSSSSSSSSFSSSATEDDWSLVTTFGATPPEPVQPNAYFNSWVSVADFLLFRGAEFFDTGFSTERTAFNPSSKLMMVLSYPAHMVSGPLVVDRANKITFETLLSALVQFARLTVVVAVQRDRTRCVYLMGPTMERMYRALVSLPDADKNANMVNFRKRYENAKSKGLRVLYGPEKTLEVHPDRARFPHFKDPARLALAEGGTPICCLYVHDVSHEPCASGGFAYFLDLGCAIRAPDAHTIVRLTMPDAFLMKHLAVQKTTDIVYDATPGSRLDRTVVIGPVFLHRYASPEEARASLVGKVAVAATLVSTELMSVTATTHVSLEEARADAQKEMNVAHQCAREVPPDVLAQQIVYRDDVSLKPVTTGMGFGAGGGEPSVEDYMRIREQELETLRLAASNGTLFP